MSRQNRLLITTLSLFLILPGIASAEEPFTSIFNGHDLSGWKAIGTPDAFMVKQNSIFTTGAGPYPSWLRSDAMYENFILRFEYKTEGWYEGGVLLHAPADGPASKLGMKLHLRHDQHEYGARSPGAIYDAAAPLSIANLPSQQWNKCEILCDWPTLRVTLNGKLIHDINMETHEKLRHRLRRGFIGIQNIGCQASFRKIEICALPDKEHWINLFDSGLYSLLRLEDTDWSLEGDLLTGEGKNGFIVTKRKFSESFQFQVWVKTRVNGNGGLHFYWQDGNHGVEVQCFNAPDSTNPTGSLYGIVPANRIVSFDQQWFLVQVFADGPNAMVMVNGEKVSETNALKPPYQGSIGFQQHTPGSVIMYRGARIKKDNWR